MDIKKYIYILSLLLFLIILDTCVHYINYNKLKKNFPENFISKNNEYFDILRNENEYFNKKIPYTLFRTYTNKEKAQKFDKAKNVTLKNNPYLTEVFFDDDDIEKFIKDKYSDIVYESYMKINPIYGPARADFFRYLVIYYYGGLYLDIKSSAFKNIKKLFDEKDKLIVSKGRVYNYNPNTFGIIPTFKNNYDWGLFSGVNCGEYNNWHFMAPPRHPILRKAIEQIIFNIQYNNDKYNYGEYSVLTLTGPILFSRIISKYGNKDNLLIKNPNFNKSVLYNQVDHKSGNKTHYSKLEDKNVLLV